MKNTSAVYEYKTEYEALKAENAQLKSEIERLNFANEKLTGENENLKISNDWYLEQLRLAQHRRFGASSEKGILPGQLGIFNEAEVFADILPEEIKCEEETTITYKRKKCKGKRKEFYENLPTEQIIHELPESERICPECGRMLHACGHEVLRREVEIIPAQVKAIEHVQTVYSCRDCEKNAVDDPPPMVKSNVPAPVIPGSGLASPSLLSFILCNKYVLALPLYRQEQELARIGIHISRQTMANWVIYAAIRWLEPIYRLLHTALLRNNILHADESTTQVIKENGRTYSQKSYMWMYHTGRDAAQQVALFEYQPTREGKHPQHFLKGFCGFLHVDAYSGYKGLEEQGIILVECWAHVRRKFYDTIKALKKEERQHTAANVGLEYCDKLFELERKFDELELTHDQRRKRRELESRPIAEAFFEWAESMTAKSLPKSMLGQAVSYAVNQRQWLMKFLLDGRLELSNNRAERSIRPFTVGRKNWLFSYCAKGAKASAIVYSIVETAQANGLVPFMYLAYLFQTLPNIKAEQFSDCLPWSPIVQEICKIPKKL
jgi:transposase/FtsZ-binding cell division protein ZapB